MTLVVAQPLRQRANEYEINLFRGYENTHIFITTFVLSENEVFMLNLFIANKFVYESVMI